MREGTPSLVKIFEKDNKNKQSGKKEQVKGTSQQGKLCFGSQNYSTKTIIAKIKAELHFLKMLKQIAKGSLVV